jgi:ABC-type sulfate transport system permease component
MFASSPLTDAPTASITGPDTCFRQIEFVGILKGTPHGELARRFVDFMLSAEFQADIPGQMFVYPVHPRVSVPDDHQLRSNAAQPATLPPAEIALNRATDQGLDGRGCVDRCWVRCRSPWRSFPAHAALLRRAVGGFALTFLAVFFPAARASWLSVDPTVLSAQSAPGSDLGFTLYQAVLSTILTLAVGIPAAVLFAHYTFPGKALLRALTAVPFMLPTVVVAAGFSALLGPRGWLNLMLVRIFDLSGPPIVFTGTLGAILLAHVFYNTTIVIRLVGGALSSLDPKLRQAASTLGADPSRVWRRVVIPLLRPPLMAAVLLVFLFDFTSFGVILLLGGLLNAEVQICIQALQMLDLPSLHTTDQLLCTVGF